MRGLTVINATSARLITETANASETVLITAEAQPYIDICDTAISDAASEGKGEVWVHLDHVEQGSPLYVTICDIIRANGFFCETPEPEGWHGHPRSYRDMYFINPFMHHHHQHHHHDILIRWPYVLGPTIVERHHGRH